MFIQELFSATTMSYAQSIINLPSKGTINHLMVSSNSGVVGIVVPYILTETGEYFYLPSRVIRGSVSCAFWELNIQVDNIKTQLITTIYNNYKNSLHGKLTVSITENSVTQSIQRGLF